MKRIHPLAGGMALLIILVFWLSTALVELFGDAAAVTLVKTAIPWGFLVLIPALALTGISGMRLARGRDGPLVRTKRRRMPFVAANGILILVPAALYLAMKARAGEFDTGFGLVQVVELVAGAVNIVLLGLNMRDGLRLTGRLQRRPGSAHRAALP